MAIEIGKAIYSILSNDEAITAKVNDKIFPLVANPDTTFPFIIYKRTDIQPHYTKDLYTGIDDVTINIVVAANNYNDSIIIANLVRNALDNKRGVYSDIYINTIRMDVADEDYIENTFIQNLQFKINTKWQTK